MADHHNEELTEETEQGQEQEEAEQPTEQHEEETTSKKLQEAEEALQKKTVELELYKHASAKGISGVDKMLPYINYAAFEGDEQKVGELVEILTSFQPKKTQPKAIGGASNHSKQTDKTSHQLLADAADKAKKSGKTEDRAAFSALKQKLSGGN